MNARGRKILARLSIVILFVLLEITKAYSIEIGPLLPFLRPSCQVEFPSEALDHPLQDGDRRFEEFAQKLLQRGINNKNIKSLGLVANRLADPHGRATPQLQKDLMEIDEKFAGKFYYSQMRYFQKILGELGVSTKRPILMPKNKVPYWLKDGQPLANFQSAPHLPAKADVVIIGAGLTGAAAAYHLSLEARKNNLTIVLLDSGDPANQASGRNGGNFELYPENFLEKDDGLENTRLRFLQKVYPNVDPSVLKKEARRQAEAVMTFTGLNRDIFLETVRKENINADVAANGWVRIAESAEEVEGFKRDQELAASKGHHVEIWPSEKIAQQTNVVQDLEGRYTGDGYYHPFKFTTGLIKVAIGNGVKLFTRHPVIGPIKTLDKDRHLVKTAKGTIEAKFVIAAMNAFSGTVFKELTFRGGI